MWIMAQETWGLKLDQDLKEKLQSIIKEDFESSKDFMEQLISLYELNKLKQGSNVLTDEIDQLESLTRRINSIFINANEKIGNMLQEKDIKAEQQVELKNKLIERLQCDIAKLEQEKEHISSINDSLVNSNTEYSQEVSQLTKSNRIMEDLVSEYKEKNDTLTGLLSEYKADREQNKSLQEQLQIMVKELDETRTELELSKQEVVKVKASLQTQLNTHKNELQELLTKHSDELVTLKREIELEANMKLLEAQQELQSKTQLLQEKNNTEIKQYQSQIQALQDKHNVEIEQYQTKYKELLERLEHRDPKKKNNIPPKK